MSTIAELRKQDSNICQALLKATQELREYTAQIADLPDPRTADLDQLEQLKITCAAVQEYLIRHREKMGAANLPVQGQNLSVTTPSTVTETTTATGALALSAMQSSGLSLASTSSVPPIQPPRLSLLTTGAPPSEQKPRLSLNPNLTSTPYLTLSGKPPSKVLSLRSQKDAAK